MKGIKAQLKTHKIQPDDRKSIKGVEIIVRMLFTNTHDDAQVIYQMWEKLFAEKKNSIIQRRAYKAIENQTRIFRNYEQNYHRNEFSMERTMCCS